MPIEVRNAQRQIVLDRRRLIRAGEQLLVELKLEATLLSVLIASNRVMSRLHEDWMGETGPTDVISFPAGMGPAGPVPLLGDIVISAEVAAEQAKQKKRSGERNRKASKAEVTEQVLKLMIHGLLHLTGSHHRTPATRKRMFQKMRQLYRATL